MPLITPEEHRARLERLQSAVAAAELDVFLVSSFDSIYYLTGAGFEPLERPFFLAVYPSGSRQPSLLVPRLDAEHMQKAWSVRDIRTYWDHPAPAGRRWSDVLRELTGEARQVGIEPSLPLNVAEALRELAPVVAPLIEKLRVVKSPDEVAMIRRTANYCDRAVQQLLAASYRGATVAEGFVRTGAISRALIREVDDWEALTTHVLMVSWGAPRSAQPHSVPVLNDRLHEGPHVALAFLRVNGYAAESERTYFTARPSREMVRAFRAMERARNIAFRMILPGVSCGEIDAAVNEFLRAEGYGGEERRLHRTGHGIGLGNHEAPWVAEGSDDVLAENMVISVEPGIYLAGDNPGGYRHSDTVLVTRDGYECLTRLPTDLRSMMVTGWKPVTRIRGALVRHALRPVATRSGADGHDGPAHPEANAPQRRRRPGRLARRIKAIGGLTAVVAGVLFLPASLVARWSLPLVKGEWDVPGPKTMIVDLHGLLRQQGRPPASPRMLLTPNRSQMLETADRGQIITAPILAEPESVLAGVVEELPDDVFGQGGPDVRVEAAPR